MLQKLMQFIVPSECLGCGESGSVLCGPCTPQLVTTKVPSCFYCNKLTFGGQACSTCQRKVQLRGVHVLWRLEGAAQDLVYRLKYHNDRSVAQFVADQASFQFELSGYDLVTAVASDGKALRRRGYNQAELLARAVARQAAVPYSTTLLRTQHTSQTHLGRHKRFEVVQGNFVCYQPKKVAGKRVLIVDDVLTTGATMAECARLLRLADAKQVWGLVAAKK